MCLTSRTPSSQTPRIRCRDTRTFVAADDQHGGRVRLRTVVVGASRVRVVAARRRLRRGAVEELLPRLRKTGKDTLAPGWCASGQATAAKGQGVLELPQYRPAGLRNASAGLKCDHLYVINLFPRLMILDAERGNCVQLSRASSRSCGIDTFTGALAIAQLAARGRRERPQSPRRSTDPSARASA